MFLFRRFMWYKKKNSPHSNVELYSCFQEYSMFIKKKYKIYCDNYLKAQFYLQKIYFMLGTSMDVCCRNAN